LSSAERGVGRSVEDSVGASTGASTVTVTSSGSASNSADKRQLELSRRLLQLLLQDFTGAVSVRLWNGETVAGPAQASTVFELRKAAPLRDMLFGKNLNRLAEAYLAGDVGYQGSLERIFDLIDFL